MTARTLSGVELAQQIRADVTKQAAALAAAGRPARLVIVSANDDESSAWYIRSIASAAAASGIVCTVDDLGRAAGVEEIRGRLAGRSLDPEVSAIMLQTPLPAGASLSDLGTAIDPAKDVDGANPASLGRLAVGLPAFAPATAAAVLAILDHHEVDLAGRHAVVVGRSAVVGKPVAHLLLARQATVTVCHSRTPDLAAQTSRADVLVVAIGQAQLITWAHVRPGAIVIDVGTNPTDEGGLVGDVDAASVSDQAGGLTPVPGGVGPVTTAVLLRHTVTAAHRGLPG